MEGEREGRLFISVPGRAADLITTSPSQKVTAKFQDGFRMERLLFLYAFLFLTGHAPAFLGLKILSCSSPYQTFFFKLSFPPSLQRTELRPRVARPFSVVVAIDFGTTSSGYAFSFTEDPEVIHMMR